MPGILTASALAILINQCAGPNPPADLLMRYIMEESAGQPNITNHNNNGSIDYGLGQINDSNFALLTERLGVPVTPTTILDPCLNIAATTLIMRTFSGMATGSPERGFVLHPPGQNVSYVERMIDPKFRRNGSAAPASAQPIQVAQSQSPPCAAPAWDTWGREECKETVEPLNTSPGDQPP